jgi:DUF1365 family protein
MSIVKICFGKVRHSRLKPAKNAFAYSVFSLRIPMRLRKSKANGIRQFGLGDNSFSWLSFHDKDYGVGQEDALSWALEVAQNNGVKDIDGEVWLQTFPRVLNYVFNPVSFWFFENKHGDLKAILAEVNNTFGEKHCYLLFNSDGSKLIWGQTFLAKKVFHVSPFCEVKGHYKFRFFKSSDETPQHLARIEYHDEGPLLITSISGKETSFSNKQLFKVIFTYPIMSFGVIFKIHWQALKLWLKGIQFHSKPSAPQTLVSK